MIDGAFSNGSQSYVNFTIYWISKIMLLKKLAVINPSKFLHVGSECDIFFFAFVQLVLSFIRQTF